MAKSYRTTISREAGKQFKDLLIKYFNIYTWQYSHCVIIFVTTGIHAVIILKRLILQYNFCKNHFLFRTKGAKDR